MKKIAKVALVLMCAVALVVCSILGTLAYLQAKSEVAHNTFTAGNVAITLDEAKVTEYGEEVVGADRVLANSYKLIAGHTYAKDPTVVVAAGSEECYVKMEVTITDITDIKAVFGATFLPEKFTNGTWDSAIWNSVEIKDNGNNSMTYVFYYHDTVDARTGAVTLEPLFTEFVLPGNVSNADIAKIADMSIDVVAYAIQADGFANAATAFANFNNAQQ